jgi:hypothetical protein
MPAYLPYTRRRSPSPTDLPPTISIPSTRSLSRSMIGRTLLYVHGTCLFFGFRSPSFVAWTSLFVTPADWLSHRFTEFTTPSHQLYRFRLEVPLAGLL